MRTLDKLANHSLLPGLLLGSLAGLNLSPTSPQILSNLYLLLVYLTGTKIRYETIKVRDNQLVLTTLVTFTD